MLTLKYITWTSKKLTPVGDPLVPIAGRMAKTMIMTLKILKYFLVLSILTIGCEKTPFDYRNKFCGLYDFRYTAISWTSTNGYYSAIDGTYSGKVFYDKKASPDQIIINFTDSRTVIFAIDRQGKATGCGGSGQFEKRKAVTFQYETSSCPGGGHGGGTNYTVTGTRK